MGKARWWVCDDCKSLNDLPANKCYNCRSGKPASPTLMDDQYDQVSAGSTKRVGISVDLSTLGDLVAPDPLERAEGGGIIEAYVGGEGSEAPQPSAAEGSSPAPPPIREPQVRSISDLGGVHWDHEDWDAPDAASQESSDPAPQHPVPPPAAQPPPPPPAARPSWAPPGPPPPPAADEEA